MASIISKASRKFLWEWRLAAARERPWTVAALVLLGAVNALAEGLSIGLLIPLLTTLFNRSDPFEAMGELGNILRPALSWIPPDRLLIGSLGLIFLLVVLRSVAGLIAGRLSLSLSTLIGCRLRSELYQRIIRAPFLYIARAKRGELHALLDTDSWQVAQAIESFLELISRVVIVVAITATMLAISTTVTLLVAALGSAYVAVFSVTNGFNARIAAERRDAVEKLATVEQESMDNMRTIRAFGREATSHHAFDTIGRRVAALELRKNAVNGIANALREPAYILVFAATLLFGRSGISGAALIAMLALLNRIQPHLTAINDYHQSWPTVSPAIEKLCAVFAMTDAQPREDGICGTRVERAISFKDVVFSYRPEEADFPPAINQLSMNIPHGRVTALVGPSGSGKTTIANLLLRLYMPQSGQILADDVDIATLDVSDWRHGLSIAGQDAELTSGTLRDNIAFGSPDACQTEIERVAAMAGIDAFINSLPQGYDTPVSHRGLTLSGGQRQRIGLARALLRKNALLILDEATNALDALTEERVLRALRALKGAATILVITHRLNVARIADHIVVLNDGRAVDEGAPADVYERDGLFREMVQAQSLAQQLSEEGWLD